MSSDDVPDSVFLKPELDAIESAILSLAWAIVDEEGVHRMLAQILDRDYVEEFRLDAKSRPDFFHVELGIAIEVKVDGSPSAVASQLMRYAQHESVRAVVLVASAKRLTAGLGPTLRGKPLRVVGLWRSSI